MLTVNSQGWNEAIAKAAKDAEANGGAYRVQIVRVPNVPALFEIPTVTAEA